MSVLRALLSIHLSFLGNKRGSFGCNKLQVSFAKEPYKIDDILQKRPIILWSLLIVATPYDTFVCEACINEARLIRGCDMGWLPLVGSLKLQVSFAKEPYKRDDILQKRPIILWSLLIVATPYETFVCEA